MMISGTAGAVLAIALGTFICFFGYRLLRVTLAVAGFGFGAGLGWFVASGIAGVAPVVVLIVTLVSGILGAVLAAVLLKFGVFLLGASVGSALALAALAGRTGTGPTLVVVGVALVFGVVTVLVQRTMISILTAFAGSWGVVLGAFHLARWLDMNAGFAVPAGLGRMPGRLPLVLGAWLLLGVVGTIVQLAQGRKKK